MGFHLRGPSGKLKFDAFQVLRSVYDVDKNCLRVCVVDGSTGGGPGFEVIITHLNDSIRLGDGTNFFTSTQIGPDLGLDVNVIGGNIDIEVDAADGDNILIVGKEDGTLHEIHVDAKGQVYTNDNLDCGGTSGVFTITDTPVVLKVAASVKADRKTVIFQPRAKGLYWGFNANVTADDNVTGGFIMGKRQPGFIDATKNTAVYLVGPPAGIKVFIGEA